LATTQGVDPETLADSIRRVADHAHTEEDLRIGVEQLLQPVRELLGITAVPRYERRYARIGAMVLGGGRSDAVYGHAVLEYERPGALRTEPGVRHAQAQLERYLRAEAHSSAAETEDVLRRSVGIALDGYHILFVRYRRKTAEQPEPEPLLPEAQLSLLPMEQPAGLFRREGPFAVSPGSVAQFLVYLRALRRRLLTPEGLADAFGPSEDVAQQVVAALLEAFQGARHRRVRTLYAEWNRIFGIVYGQELAKALRDTRELATLYGVPEDADLKALLFAVHTYFALLMKLLAAELASLQSGSILTSPMADLPALPSGQFRARLEDLEGGGLFGRVGIRNFLEGDFFGWYLSAWSGRLESAVRDMIRTLQEYEPATGSLLPEATRDLIKKLYQYLVPRRLRHDLGEYYTPDWLAELVLDEVGYHGEKGVRVLDPACGSGTFLALAIRRAREAADDRLEEPRETVQGILANITGFDLNPLAVIAARTTYLLSLGTLVREISPIEIPVYLCDSVLTPSTYEGQMERRFDALAEPYRVPSVVGEFQVPREFAAKQRLESLTRVLEECARMKNYNVDAFLQRVQQEVGPVENGSQRILARLFQKIAALEKDGRNGIWARILKNNFAPIFVGQVDLVVGNPPWVRWGYLSDDYRQATQQLWMDYGLFSLKGMAARLGGGEKDFSMLFLYACADYYLRPEGRLGFVITQEVLKSKGAGEGFRRFKLGANGQPLCVLKAADLVAVKPFEGAANKTAVIVVEKGRATSYPVPYTVWRRKRGVGPLDTGIPLADALRLTDRHELLASPVGNSKTGSWQSASPALAEVLARVGGTPRYAAHRGASTEPYGVFWLHLKHVRPDGLLVVENLPELGKRDIPKLEATLEATHVYPAVRGRDIQRWRATPNVYVLVVQDPQTREGYPEGRMQLDWPNTYSYLLRFRDILLSRGSHVVRELAERTVFYTMYGIGPYTFAPQKVVWKRMAGDLVACVVSTFPTPFGDKDGIPTDTTSLIPFQREAEAHYVCALLNSTPCRAFVRSFSSAGRGFGAPSIIQQISLPRFAAKKELHDRLSSLSVDAHCRAAEEMQVTHVEQEIDQLAAQLWGISDSELDQMRAALLEL
jgi:SAM-dependent methyltransferase